jgi:NADH-quinone oxidoreductase subunit C/D
LVGSQRQAGSWCDGSRCQRVAWPFHLFGVCIPEGEYYIKQKPIIKVPEGQWYFSVEGASGEFGVYLDSKGDKSPYRMKMRPMGLSLTGALDPMLRGQKIADLITTGAAIDFVIPDIDR